MPKPKETIAHLLEDNELKISMLYKTYAQKFPSHQLFWSNIAKEEVSHAKEVRQTFQKEGNAFLEADEFSKETIQKIAEFVEAKIKEAKKEKISNRRALKTALKIEKSILEKKIFAIFTKPNLKLREMIKGLKQDTNDHARRIQKEIDALK